jgi:hypothetical protein
MRRYSSPSGLLLGCRIHCKTPHPAQGENHRNYRSSPPLVARWMMDRQRSPRWTLEVTRTQQWHLIPSTRLLLQFGRAPELHMHYMSHPDLRPSRKIRRRLLLRGVKPPWGEGAGSIECELMPTRFRAAPPSSEVAANHFDPHRFPTLLRVATRSSEVVAALAVPESVRTPVRQSRCGSLREHRIHCKIQRSTPVHCHKIHKTSPLPLTKPPQPFRQ